MKSSVLGGNEDNTKESLKKAYQQGLAD